MNILALKRIAISYQSVLEGPCLPSYKLALVTPNPKKRHLYLETSPEINFLSKKRNNGNPSLTDRTLFFYSQETLPSFSSPLINYSFDYLRQSFLQTLLNSLIRVEKKAYEIGLGWRLRLFQQFHYSQYNQPNFQINALNHRSHSSTGMPFLDIRNFSPFFNQICFLLNDLLKLTNISFHTSFNIVFPVHTPLDHPVEAIKKFSTYLSLTSMVFNRVAGMDYLDAFYLEVKKNVYLLSHDVDQLKASLHLMQALFLSQESYFLLSSTHRLPQPGYGHF